MAKGKKKAEKEEELRKQTELANLKLLVPHEPVTDAQEWFGRGLVFCGIAAMIIVAWICSVRQTQTQFEESLWYHGHALGWAAAFVVAGGACLFGLLHRTTRRLVLLLALISCALPVGLIVGLISATAGVIVAVLFLLVVAVFANVAPAPS